MSVRVSRGLLATERGLGVGRTDPRELAERAVERLSRESPRGYQWKDRAQWASRLSHGNGDWRGRRVFTEAGRTDCRYVARVCRAAWLKSRLPEGRVWGNLRASLERIFAELESGDQGGFRTAAELRERPGGS